MRLLPPTVMLRVVSPAASAGVGHAAGVSVVTGDSLVTSGGAELTASDESVGTTTDVSLVGSSELDSDPVFAGGTGGAGGVTGAGVVTGGGGGGVTGGTAGVVGGVGGVAVVTAGGETDGAGVVTAVESVAVADAADEFVVGSLVPQARHNASGANAKARLVTRGSDALRNERGEAVNVNMRQCSWFEVMVDNLANGIAGGQMGKSPLASTTQQIFRASAHAP